MSAGTSPMRQEQDSIGVKDISAHVYYGVQTASAVENYPISSIRSHPTLVKAFGMVKRAAAMANKDLGLVDEKRADAIIRAANEVIEGKWNDEFRGRGSVQLFPHLQSPLIKPLRILLPSLPRAKNPKIIQSVCALDARRCLGRVPDFNRAAEVPLRLLILLFGIINERELEKC